MDEAGIFVKTVYRKAGKKLGDITTQSFREEHPYLSYFWRINGEGSVEFDHKSGTAITDCYQFILLMLDIIGPDTHQKRRFFTMNNISAHQNHIILRLIHG